MPRDVIRFNNQLQPILLWIGIFCLFFVVYGSLVPFDYQVRSFPEISSRFLQTFSTVRGGLSLLNWTINILLFVPVAFFWQGLLWTRKGYNVRISGYFGVWIACVALSFSIEFVQVFSGRRASAQEDIVAQAIGAALGILLWVALGPQLVAFYERRRTSNQLPWQIGKIVWGSLFLSLGILTIMPLDLDLSLSPVEVFYAWKTENLTLLTSDASSCAGIFYNLYALMRDILYWFSCGFLFGLIGIKRTLCFLIGAMLVALALEGVQLLFYSDIRSLREIVLIIIGSPVGAFVGESVMCGSEPQRNVKCD